MTSVAADNEQPTASELYRLAVEEYRFQAQFNWSRVQYLLAFNAAILAVGVALIPSSGAAAVSIFAIGALAAVMTALVHRVQHTYYRKARDRMRSMERTFGIAQEMRVNTTSNLSGEARKISVTQVVYMLLGGIALADALSIVFVIIG